LALQSYIYISSDKTLLENAIAGDIVKRKISIFDQITLTPTINSSIGISDVRLFIKKLSLTPQGGSLIAGIIPEAHLLTVEAQQALLKTLEEPPRMVILYIGIDNPQKLLPTIISRCQLCIVPTPRAESQSESKFKEIETILHQDVSTRFASLQSVGKTKEEIYAWSGQALVALRNSVIESIQTAQPASQHDKTATRLLHRLLTMHKYERSNINPMLLLEDAFV
jgi:DNA polymerase III delta prime subunit